jgi:hypothetical protein
METKGVQRIGARRLIKRKPGKSKNYFTSQTQESIIKFQKAPTLADKHKIYEKEIFPAFDALVENLINVYGFNVIHETKKDLKSECVEFLYSTIMKFNSEKNSKAFSYFNVVAKRYLIIRSKQNVKNVQRYISLDNQETISAHDMDTIENYSIVPTWEDMLEQKNLRENVRNLINEIENLSTTDNEKETVRAIKIVLDQLDDLDLVSKRAILLYIREITNLAPKQLSVVLSNLKKHYRSAKRNLEDIT